MLASVLAASTSHEGVSCVEACVPSRLACGSWQSVVARGLELELVKAATKAEIAAIALSMAVLRSVEEVWACESKELGRLTAIGKAVAIVDMTCVIP